MASLRSSVTVANVEAGSDDYSGIYDKYTDAFIEDKISEAEVLVEQIIHTTLSSSSEARYLRAVIVITRMIMRNEMIDDGMLDDDIIENYFTIQIMNLLSNSEEEDMVDIIPTIRPRGWD